jgi:hypothetical protein
MEVCLRVDLGCDPTGNRSQLARCCGRPRPRLARLRSLRLSIPLHSPTAKEKSILADAFFFVGVTLRGIEPRFEA